MAMATVARRMASSPPPLARIRFAEAEASL